MRISDWSSDVCSSDLQPPVRGVSGIALVRNGDGQGRHDAVVSQAAHWAGSWRFFMALVSMQRAVPGKVGANAFISPRWILLERMRVVMGRSLPVRRDHGCRRNTKK